MSFLFGIFIEIVLLFGFLSGLARQERVAWWFGVFNRNTFYLMYIMLVGSISSGVNLIEMSMGMANLPTALIAVYGYWKWGKLKGKHAVSPPLKATDHNLLDDGLATPVSSNQQIQLFSTYGFSRAVFWALGVSSIYVLIYIYGNTISLDYEDLISFLFACSIYLFFGFWMVGLHRLANYEQTGWYLLAMGAAIRIVGFVLQMAAFSDFRLNYLRYISVSVLVLMLCWQGKNAWEQNA